MENKRKEQNRIQQSRSELNKIETQNRTEIIIFAHSAKQVFFGIQTEMNHFKVHLT